MIEIGNRALQEEEFYLDPKAGLDRLQKIQYFDELKEKYLQMVETFTSIESKCVLLEEQIKVVEKGKVTPRSVGSGGKTLPGLDGSSGGYEEILDDSSLPEGWRAAWRKAEGLAQVVGLKYRCFWAPNGRFLGNRVSSLHHMVTELKSSKEDVAKMRAKLLEEEWEEHSALPSGWLCAPETKSSIQTGTKFLSDTFTFFRNVRSALRHLVVNSSEEELSCFLAAFWAKGIEVVKWLRSPSLPFPWRLAETRNLSGAQGILVLGPDGQLHTNWKKCREGIVREGGMDQQVSNSPFGMSLCSSFLGSVSLICI